MAYLTRWWYNNLVMDLMKTQTRFQAFFLVFKQAIRTVERHFYLILLPLALDLFLLFGPRLGLSKILNPIIASLPAIDNFEQQFGLSWEAFLARTMESVGQFNVFSSLRTLPFGVPSMMSQRLGIASPFGAVQQLELSSFSAAILAFLLLSLVGVFLGTVYFKLISRAVRQAIVDDSKPSNSILLSYLNLVALNLLTWLVGLVLLIPAVIVLGLLLRLSPSLGYVAYMLVTILVLSFVMPLVFTPIFVIAERSSFFQAAFDSVKLTRKSGILFSMFIVLSISAYYLTNLLWNSAPDTSPFVLVGVFGHALVTTILLTASFHFVEWLEKAENGQKPLIV